MAEHIIDSMVTIFKLNTEDFKSGVRKIDEESRKLKDGQKKTFDEIEVSGKKTGEAIKGVTREVIGLGLAFMGARSITGFLGNMATGAASADRFGKTLGMSVQKVWAWRQAMKGFGGQESDADASLQRVQSAKMQFQRGQMGAAERNQWGMLGINGGDLKNADADEILRKLAGSRLAKSNPQFFSDSLQQLGLSAPMISMLMTGQDSVDKLIKQNEAAADGQEKLAHETEKLQLEMAKLNGNLKETLTPFLTTVLHTLNGFFSDNDPEAKTGAGRDVDKTIDFLAKMGLVTLPVATKQNAAGNPNQLLPPEWGGGSSSFASSGASVRQRFIAQHLMANGLRQHQVLGIMAGLHGENAGFDPDTRGGYKNRAIGIGQWLGSRREELLRRYGQRPNLQQQLDFLMWELKGGDRGGPSVLAQNTAHGTMGAYFKNFMRPQGARNEHLQDLMADMRRGSLYLARAGGGVTINGGIHVKTAATDSDGIARHMGGAVKRRMAVAQADRVVNP